MIQVLEVDRTKLRGLSEICAAMPEIQMLCETIEAQTEKGTLANDLAGILLDKLVFLREDLRAVSGAEVQE